MAKSIVVTRIDELDEQVVKIDKTWVLVRQHVYNKLVRTLSVFTNARERELIDGKFYAVKTREAAVDTKYEAAARMYQEIQEVLIPDLIPLDMAMPDKHRSLMLRLSDIVEHFNGATHDRL